MASKAQVKQLNDAQFQDWAADAGRDNNLENLPVTEQLILFRAKAFIDNVRENLDRLGKVTTGKLSDDITQGELLRDRFQYELDLGYRDNRYFDFVNKGVRGRDSSKKAPNSPYGFRNKMPPIKPLINWLKDNNISARKEDQTRNLSALQSKRQTIKKAVDETTRIRSLAFAIAKSIQKGGIERTGFFDDAVDANFGKTFIQELSKSVGYDVRVYIQKANNSL